MVMGIGQGPTHRFSGLLGSGIEKKLGSGFGLGLGRSVEILDWVFLDTLFMLGLSRVFSAISREASKSSSSFSLVLEGNTAALEFVKCFYTNCQFSLFLYFFENFPKANYTERVIFRFNARKIYPSQKHFT